MRNKACYLNLKRSRNKYQLYNQQALDRLIFIKRAKQQGFKLDQIWELLYIQKNQQTSEAIKAMTQQHILQIREQIDFLTDIESNLKEKIHACQGALTHPDHCPILKEFVITRPC